jgi:hypothetical protein
MVFWPWPSWLKNVSRETWRRAVICKLVAVDLKLCYSDLVAIWWWRNRSLGI